MDEASTMTKLPLPLTSAVKSYSGNFYVRDFSDICVIIPGYYTGACNSIA